jgi:hypothetical protein
VYLWRNPVTRYIQLVEQSVQPHAGRRSHRLHVFSQFVSFLSDSTSPFAVLELPHYPPVRFDGLAVLAFCFHVVAKNGIFEDCELLGTLVSAPSSLSNS